jgi:hypothetical protein
MTRMTSAAGAQVSGRESRSGAIMMVATDPTWRSMLVILMPIPAPAVSIFEPLG